MGGSDAASQRGPIMKIHTIHGTSGNARSGFGFSHLALCGLIAVAVSSGITHAQTSVGTAMQRGLFTHQGQSYQVVDSASYLSTEVAGSNVAQVACQSCNSCGTSCSGSCGGGLGGGLGCGLLDGRGCNLTDDGCNYGMADVCAPCQPYWYGVAEGLFIERDGGDDRTTSADFQMNGFDYEWAGRYTFGRVPDCVHGCEISYTGLFQWDSRGEAAGVGLNTLLTTQAPLGPANISAFNGATFQSQDYEAEYWSVEANRTLMGWDVAKLLYGVRYMEYDEGYRYFSDTGAATGLLQSGVDNQLFGVQVGLDLLYPVSRCGYADFRGRVGGFLNSVDSEFRLINDGNLEVANFDDDEAFCGMIELSSGIRFRFGSWSIRGGAELWYLSKVASAMDQFGSVIATTTGSRSRLDDDVLMTGLSLGAQLRY